MIRFINNKLNELTYEQAKNIIASKNKKSEKIIKASDSSIETYDLIKNLNIQETKEVFEILFAHIYIDKYFK